MTVGTASGRPAVEVEHVVGRSDWLGADPASGVGAVHEGCDVQVLIDAPAYYAQLREAVQAAGDGDLICWAGFQSGLGTPVPVADEPPAPGFARRTPQPDDVTWGELLAGAVRRGARLRVLLNLHPEPSGAYRESNLEVVQALNRLPRTGAVNDFRYLHVNGTHHQKLVVVHTAAGLTAFVATMDVRAQRIEERWCEVAVRLRGAAARDVYTVFHDRWVEHDATLALLDPDRRDVPSPGSLRVGPTDGHAPDAPVGPAEGHAPDVPLGPAAGHAQVQVSTTYGNPGRPHPFGRRRSLPPTQVLNTPHVLTLSRRPPLSSGNDFFTGRDPAAPPLLAAAAAQAPGYAFAPHGRHAVYDQLRAALARPSRTIYLEDQYLVADEPMGDLPSMLDLLVARVSDPSFESLVVLTTRVAEINRSFLGLGAAHRRAFVRRLVAAGGSKVLVCHYRSNADLGTGLRPPSAAPFYVHSKTWVFDDELLVTGSANCNRRGYSHDSELDVAVVDPTLVAQTRRRLWVRRLNAGLAAPVVTEDDVADPVAAARFWAQPERLGLAVQNHRIGLTSFLAGAPTRVPSLLGDLATARLAQVYKISPARLPRWLWDVVVDPEGT
ncbi:phospholipase D-like domain-containing protein [Cellulomonas citrea]|uniref:phospholipase D-like domain-containing protein n=1 Tax=Cellulomonas citrea TaxID=1909423 RepID=UPI0013591981|nr:phospholipase D-like domain-containing protein [Cellulomonas citrea]